MTSCWSGCWIGFKDGLRSVRRTLYLTGRSGNRARYNEAKATVEFETLIDDDDCEFEPTPSFTRHILTEDEQQLINQRKYDQLVEQQRRLDRQVDAKLQREEEELRLQEEALYEAKRKAAKAAKQSKLYEEKRSHQNNKLIKTPKFEADNAAMSSWLSDDSAELDAEDFDSFLEKVKARSLTSPSKQVGKINRAVSNGGLMNGSWEPSMSNTNETTKVTGKPLDAFKILDLSPAESDDRTTDVER